MSKDLNTKYLHIDYIFQDRILFVEKPIIVDTSLKIKTIKDIIGTKLKIKPSNDNFTLFCNSKLCLDDKIDGQTLYDVFGMESLIKKEKKLSILRKNS